MAVLLAGIGWGVRQAVGQIGEPGRRCLIGYTGLGMAGWVYCAGRSGGGGDLTKIGGLRMGTKGRTGRSRWEREGAKISSGAF